MRIEYNLLVLLFYLLNVKLSRYNVFHTDLGNVYMWGRLYTDKLTNVQTDQLIPKLVDPLLGKKIASIASGHSHTIAITGTSITINRSSITY
jgi:alpha-tubulin suppressor-like RCC1 family protein